MQCRQASSSSAPSAPARSAANERCGGAIGAPASLNEPREPLATEGVEGDLRLGAASGLAVERVAADIAVVIGVAQPAADLCPVDERAQLPDLAVPWPGPRPLRLPNVDRVGQRIDRSLPAGQHEVEAVAAGREAGLVRDAGLTDDRRQRVDLPMADP